MMNEDKLGVGHNTNNLEKISETVRESLRV